MSPHAAQNERIEKIATALRWLIFALLVFFLISTGSVYWQSYEGRVKVVESQRAGCERGLFDRADATDADRDLETLTLRAAAARTASHDYAVATTYRRIAAHADARIARRLPRMLGADPAVLSQTDRFGQPTVEAHAEAHATCISAIPSASPWPWSQ